MLLAGPCGQVYRLTGPADVCVQYIYSPPDWAHCSSRAVTQVKLYPVDFSMIGTGFSPPNLLKQIFPATFFCWHVHALTPWDGQEESLMWKWERFNASISNYFKLKYTVSLTPPSGLSHKSLFLASIFGLFQIAKIQFYFLLFTYLS